MIRRADLTQRPVPLCAMLSRWRSGCSCFFFRSRVWWSGHGGELAFLLRAVRPNVAARSKSSRPRWVICVTYVMHYDLCRRIAGIIRTADSRRANGGYRCVARMGCSALSGKRADRGKTDQHERPRFRFRDRRERRNSKSVDGNFGSANLAAERQKRRRPTDVVGAKRIQLEWSPQRNRGAVQQRQS